MVVILNLFSFFTIMKTAMLLTLDFSHSGTTDFLSMKMAFLTQQ